jgi:uncharacterized membrane protein YraQ (UPF0718 family)
MNHLLIEIFAYLLTAGAVGLLIGWLIKGNCKEKLLVNSQKWNQELERTNTKRQYEMKALMNKHDQYTQEMKTKELELKQQLEHQSSLLLKQKNEYKLLQMKFKKLKIDSSLELYRMDREWEEKFNNVVTKNDNSLQILNREIALLKHEAYSRI